MICNACWWWRWIPAAEDTTNRDDGITIGEPSIHSIGLLFSFSYSRLDRYFITYFNHLTRKKTHLQAWQVEDDDDEDGDGDSAVCCLLLSTCHRLEGSATSDLSTKNTHLCPSHQARPTLPLLRSLTRQTYTHMHIDYGKTMKHRSRMPSDQWGWWQRGPYSCPTYYPTPVNPSPASN